MSGSILVKSVRNQHTPATLLYYTTRCMATRPPQKTQLKSLTHMPPKRSWLTRKVEESPMWRASFFKLTRLIGYGSPKQLAGRRSFILYDKVCAVKPDEDRAFWQDGELIYLEYLLFFVRSPSHALWRILTFEKVRGSCRSCFTPTTSTGVKLWTKNIRCVNLLLFTDMRSQSVSFLQRFNLGSPSQTSISGC
jgi:hypothetical protein